MYLESNEMPILERILRRPAFTAWHAVKMQNLSLVILDKIIMIRGIH